MTAALVSALTGLGSACSPVVNDWGDRQTAPRAAYQTNRAAGYSARDLLTDTHFRRLSIEIQAVKGFAPTQEALNRLQRFLAERLHKPGGIEIIASPDIDSPVAAGLTVSAVRQVETKQRRQFSNKDEFVVYVLFVDGASADDHGDSKLVGQAYGNSSIVIYQQTLRAELAKQPALEPWVAESTLLEHEFGHLLGLVHNPLEQKSPHEDADHPAHCSNPSCLMNARVDTAAMLSPIGAGSTSTAPQVPVLDEACLADLKAAGGK